MLDFLEEAAKNMAKESAGTLMEVSMKKDWFLLKSGTQTKTNVLNASRTISLGLAENQVKIGVQGKSGKRIKEEVQQVEHYTYYNKGADSVQW